jgi:hypothetical protein
MLLQYNTTLPILIQTLRHSEPDYKLGWNSFPENPSFFVQVASRQVYRNAEAVRQSIGLFGTVQIVPVVVSGAQWYRVDIGPFASVDEATAIPARVIALYDDAFITSRWKSTSGKLIYRAKGQSPDA